MNFNELRDYLDQLENSGATPDQIQMAFDGCLAAMQQSKPASTGQAAPAGAAEKTGPRVPFPSRPFGESLRPAAAFEMPH